MADESKDAEVKAMRDQGKSNQEIATSLGITVMEVEAGDVDTMPMKPGEGEKAE